MGYSPAISNLLTAPPVIFAVISAFIFAYISDKYRLRAPVIATQCLIGITGLMITAYHSSDGVRYFGIFLGTAGCQGNIPSILAYQSNNIRLQSTRAVGSALQIGFGAIGGILASTTFMQEEAPTYRTGLWITAGLQFMTLGLVGGLTVYFMKKNKEQREGTLKEPIEGQEGLRYTL
jgi:MFS family permease